MKSHAARSASALDFTEALRAPQWTTVQLVSSNGSGGACRSRRRPRRVEHDRQAQSAEARGAQEAGHAREAGGLPTATVWVDRLPSGALGAPIRPRTRKRGAGAGILPWGGKSKDRRAHALHPPARRRPAAAIATLAARRRHRRCGSVAASDRPADAAEEVREGRRLLREDAPARTTITMHARARAGNDKIVMSNVQAIGRQQPVDDRRQRRQDERSARPTRPGPRCAASRATTS